MYPASPTPKKTIVGLPIRDIDYGNLHRSLKTAERDVKRNLQPEFIDTLDKMCLNSSGAKPANGPGVGRNKFESPRCHNNPLIPQDNSNAEVKYSLSRGASPLLNISSNARAFSPNIFNQSLRSLDQHQPLKDHQTKTYCGICRKDKENMSLYNVYDKDDEVNQVMGGVIDRIDHLIDRLGKGGYDKKEFPTRDKKKDVPGILLPCELCTLRGQKRYSEVSCQTEDLVDEDLEEGGDFDNTADSTTLPEHFNDAASLPEPDNSDIANAGTAESVVSPTNDPVNGDDDISPINDPDKPQSKIPRALSTSSSSAIIDKYGETDENASVLSSDDDEYQLEILDTDEKPEAMREYEIASKTRSEITEMGTTEIVHFQMQPYRNLYVWGERKFVGNLPPRIAVKSNYNLNYRITVFKNLSSDRIDIRKKKLKELVTKKTKSSSPRRGPQTRVLDSSKLGNLLVVDMTRYSRNRKRGGDSRIPVLNLRDGYCNKLWLSERVSDAIMSRSPRLRFALELAKSNRAHWKFTAKGLSSNQRPFPYQSLYGGKSYHQFYLSEMKRFVVKPLQSRCLVYYTDIYEGNTKDGIKSKSYVGCLGNQTSKDSKNTPIINFEEKIKEHIRLGQKLYDPKVNIFNIALQNPALCLEEPGRMLPPKGSSEITKCPMLLFVPLDFGFSTWSKPTTQDHLSPLRQSYQDVFCSNGPAGYNV